jgi:hypothetical protein
VRTALSPSFRPAEVGLDAPIVAEWFLAPNPAGQVIEDERLQLGIQLLVDSWS